MRKNLILTLMVLIGLFISFIACESKLDEYLPFENNFNSNVNIKSPVMSEDELLTICDSMQHDSDFIKLSSYLFEESYILKALEQTQITLVQLNNFQNYLKTKQATDTITYQELYNYFGNEADNFYGYMQDVQYFYFKALRNHFSSIDTSAIHSVLSCAFSVNDNNGNNESISCCEGCKGAYDRCLQHAKEDAGVVFTIGGITGICTLNPVGIAGGFVAGTIGAILSYGNDRNQCRDNYNDCKKGCNGGCK